MLVGREVGHLGDKVRELGQAVPGCLPAGSCQTHLELQVGDDRAQVGVAAALAVAVDRALHLDRALAHRRQRVGHGAFAVVVGVDAERSVGKRAFTSRTISVTSQGSVPPLVSHSTTVSAPPRAAASQRLEGVFAGRLCSRRRNARRRR